MHLCEEHARTYFSQENVDSPTNALAGLLAKQLKLEQTAESLAKLDKKTCPHCGISFAEFRQRVVWDARTITFSFSRTWSRCC